MVREARIVVPSVFCYLRNALECWEYSVFELVGLT